MPEKSPQSPEKASKFAPGERRARLRGWRRWLPFRSVPAVEGHHWQLSWGRLAAWLGLLTVAAYFFLAVGAYGFVKYKRGFREVAFLDILLPSRWSEYRIARGDHYIRQAQAELAASRFGGAYYHLRVGVAQSPGNATGRLLLAQLYLDSKQPDLARQTLLGGLPANAGNPAYLKPLFTLLFQQEDDTRIETLCRQLLPPRPVPDARNRIIAFAGASAYYNRGDYDQADALLNSYQLDGEEGWLLRARINWARGYRELAVALLKDDIAHFPESDELYVQLIRYCRKLGRDGEARAYSLMREFANPVSPAPHLGRLYAAQRQGDTAAASAEIDALFRDFPGNASVLLALGDFAADNGDPTLARRVWDACTAHHLRWEEPALMTVEALTAARQYQSALDLTQKLLRENPGLARRDRAVFDGLQAVALDGLGRDDEARLHLAQLLDQADAPVAGLLAISRRLLALGARDQARAVLAQVVKTDTRNQAALTELVKLDLATGRLTDLPANLSALLALRRPDPAVLRAARDTLEKDATLAPADRTALLDRLRAALAPTPAGAASATGSKPAAGS